MNPIKLWLDDERLPPYEVTCFSGFVSEWLWVKKAQDAIAWLQTGLVVQISFDHDLGPKEHYGDGYEVAKWIEERAYFSKMPRLKWDVHSGNPVGRDNIRAAMKNADIYWQIRADQEAMTQRFLDRLCRRWREFISPTPS